MGRDAGHLTEVDDGVIYMSYILCNSLLGVLYSVFFSRTPYVPYLIHAALVVLFMMLRERSVNNNK